MKKSIACFLILVVFCLSCSNVKETPKGFQYTVVKQGNGIVGKPGEFMVLHMVFKDGKDSTWNDTQKKGEPLFVMIRDTAAMKDETGIEELFRVLSKGDSVTFKVPAKILFEKSFHQEMPKTVDPKSEFSFSMNIIDIYSRERAQQAHDSILTVKTVQQAADRKVALSKIIAENKVQIEKDGKLIDAYLAAHKINATTDSSGIRYVITELGTGPKPLLNQSVEVNYRGSLLSDGKEFDKSPKPVKFRLLGLISGWQIGFPLIPVGSKATLYIPSSLCYGPKGSPPKIPADANLVFEVELVSIN